MNSSKKGDLVVKGKDKTAKDKLMTIKGVYCDSKSPYTVISSTKATKVNGYEIIQRGRVFCLVNSRGDYLTFDHNYETPNGFLPCMIKDCKEYMQTKIDINHAHELLEHASMDTTKLTAAALG